MSDMELTAPPPPPLPFNETSSKVLQHNFSLSDINSIDDSVVHCALKQFTDVQHFSGAGNFIALWHSTATLLQQGPQCGLVALAMAAKSVGLDIDVQSIFKEAVNMGFTRQGEMFSSQALYALANQINLQATLLTNGLQDRNNTLQLLSNGKMLLVPYDADGNHSPCLKQGHKAHWALVFGFLISTAETATASVAHGKQSIDVIDKNLFRIRTPSTAQWKIFNEIEADHVSLLAKHGKSKRVSVWSYHSLKKSNANLFEVDPKRINPSEYVLPLENKLDDLRDKIVVASKLID